MLRLQCHQPVEMKCSGGMVLLVVAMASCAPTASSTPLLVGPDPLDASNYMAETYVPFLPVSVESCFAATFVCLLGSVPVVLVALMGRAITRVHLLECAALLAWLTTMLILFTNLLSFNSGSGHFQGARPLTVVEAVYLLAQILTTVGYGDITPAYPMAQVWVAVNVILALCIYGSLVMEVADLVSQRIESAMAGFLNRDHSREVQSAEVDEDRPLKNWTSLTHVEEFTQMKKYGAALVMMVSIGVLFWHYYPGEEKTWLQAVYFSLITLSTVGFGAITATTPGGMVFGAFWMLFGVASLAGTISSFVEAMIKIKEIERLSSGKEALEFFKHLMGCSRPIPALLGDAGMDEYDCVKFGLLVQGLASQQDINRIEARFAALCSGDDKTTATITRDQVMAAEGPPCNEAAMAEVQQFKQLA